MDDKKKPGRPALKEIYCHLGLLKTSKGTLLHGDREKLPLEEANRLIAEGKAT